jgi:hypothetical protein
MKFWFFVDAPAQIYLPQKAQKGEDIVRHT